MQSLIVNVTLNSHSQDSSNQENLLAVFKNQALVDPLL